MSLAQNFIEPSGYRQTPPERVQEVNDKKARKTEEQDLLE